MLLLQKNQYYNPIFRCMSEQKQFWHELTDQQVQEVMDSGMTWGEVCEKYLQPDWCHYPRALNGEMGCWSLADTGDLRKKISHDFCVDCDCFHLPPDPSIQSSRQSSKRE